MTTDQGWIQAASALRIEAISLVLQIFFAFFTFAPFPRRQIQ